MTSIYFISKTFTENRNNNSWYYWYITTVMPLQENEQQNMIMGRGKRFVISLYFFIFCNYTALKYKSFIQIFRPYYDKFY